MANRLKGMGETASWRLMVGAARMGAEKNGYTLVRQPGRGLSNVWRLEKDGRSQVASIRTTRDRWVAFEPLAEGTKWKTLDDVELVLVAAVDDRHDPQNIDIYLFPADQVRQRFDASYKARIAAQHTVRENYGMWVKLDAGDATIPSQIGAGLAAEYSPIARFSLDELERAASDVPVSEPEDLTPEEVEEVGPSTVSAVLAWARMQIAQLTGIEARVIKLDLRIEG